MPDESLDLAAHYLRQADALLVTAGAGLGVDSGLPDFRGNEGFWRAYPALAEAGLEFTRIASPRAFRTQPEVAWGFYGHRLALYRATRPHAGFAWLRSRGRVQVFTSNVDGQFQLAGFAPDAIVECHGSIHHLQCLDRCTDAIWSAEGFQPDVDPATCRLRNAMPRCPHCGGLARPNILMFSDGEWISRRSDEQAARMESWLAQAERLTVVEIGAGTAIPWVRHVGERLVRQRKARLVRINPREPQVPPGESVGVALTGREALEELASRLD